MLFSFLSNKRRHNHKDELPVPSAELKVETQYEPSVDNDLSYGDALLDSYVRLYMKEEYGDVEPPAGVFLRVRRSIEQKLDARVTFRSRQSLQMLTGTLHSLRHALSGQIATRLLPGGMALLLILGISLSASTSHLLNGDLALTHTSNTTPLSDQIMLDTQPTETTLTFVGQVSPTVLADSSQTAQEIYDVRTPPRRVMQKDPTKNDRSRFGPE